MTLKKGELEELSCKVAEIQSKYVHAFQETLREFSARFPDHPGLHTVRDDERLTKLLSVVDQQARQADAATEHYERGRLTMGALADAVGRSPVDVWLGLVGGRDRRMLASRG